VKGEKTAFITTGIALVIFAILYAAAVYAIGSVMPNLGNQAIAFR